MPRYLLALLAVLMPTTASALSCIPPDPVGLFQQAYQAAEPYMVVYGSFDGTRMDALRPGYPGGYNENALPHQDISGLVFTGKALTRRGFTHRFRKPVTLRLSCIGPWCTGLPGGENMLAFLEVLPGGFLLDINACGGMAVSGVDQAGLRRVVTCHQGGPCVETPFD
ncbi:MAG: hypothetical protein GY717_14675 [Rhodobacteraceae bacterium]|nr:hypothetical protein [Paracoccaceae bacterium]